MCVWCVCESVCESVCVCVCVCVCVLAVYMHFPSQLFEAHALMDQVPLLMQDRLLTVSCCGVTLTVVIIAAAAACVCVCACTCVCVR